MQASLSHASAALAGQAGDGYSRAPAYQQLAGRPLLASPLASQRESGSLPLRNSPGIGSEASYTARLGLGAAGSSMDEESGPFGGRSGTVFGTSGAGGSQRVHLQRSTSAISQREGGSNQQDSDPQPRFTVNIGGLSGLPSSQSQPTPHAGAGALNVPLARLKRGGGSHLGPMAAGGASGVQLTPQGSPSPLSRSNSRKALSREVLFETTEDARSLPSNASTQLNSRGWMRLPEMPSMPQQQRQPYLGGAPSANIVNPLGSPQARDRSDGEEEGTAGALLETVRRRPLRAAVAFIGCSMYAIHTRFLFEPDCTIGCAEGTQAAVQRQGQRASRRSRARGKARQPWAKRGRPPENKCQRWW